MRLSVDSNDPNAFALWQHSQAVWGHADIYLNGVMVRECLMADTDSGTVERMQRDDVGRIVVAGDEIQFDTLCGQVEIVFREVE
jgi:hypothetical protein